MYTKLEEKQFSKIDVLSKVVQGKYRKAAKAPSAEEFCIDEPSQADSTSAEDDTEQSDDEDDPEHIEDDTPVDLSRAARAGRAPVLSATARNTLRLQAAATALCGNSDEPNDSDRFGEDRDLAERLQELYFTYAQVNAFIREQDPSRMLRFCDQEVGSFCPSRDLGSSSH